MPVKIDRLIAGGSLQPRTAQRGNGELVVWTLFLIIAVGLLVYLYST